MENKLEKYLLCSFFSVSCYLLFNPLPVSNKDKQHNDSATRVNKGTKLLNQTQVNLYECEHFPIGKAEIKKNFLGYLLPFYKKNKTIECNKKGSWEQLVTVKRLAFFINKSTVFRLAIHRKTSQKSTAWLLSAPLCEEDNCQCSAEVTTVSYLCMFLTRLSENDFSEGETRAWNLLVVSAHSPALCSFMTFNQRTPKFSPQIKEASNWEHMSDVKECGKHYDPCNITGTLMSSLRCRFPTVWSETCTRIAV